MKTTSLITLCVFLATFLVGGVALADDFGVFDSVSSESTLEAPKLTAKIDGVKVTLSWSKVTGATDYVVHYAQKPYDNPDTIKTIDVGDKTSTIYELSPGCAYHVAVKACKDSGSDCSDYSTIHDVIIPLVSSFKNSLGQEFRLIPAGSFMMGSPPDEPGRESGETQHQVTLTKSFYMQTTEVTQGQWEKLMGSNPSYFSTCGEDCPVENVTWDDAQAYIAKLNQKGEGNYALPTEAQWEYAARAGSTTAFYNGHLTEPYGNDPNLDVIAWYEYNTEDSPKATQPVAQKDANSWGLYDTTGNVREWCLDWYGDYPSGSVTDPTGPQTGADHVHRGGGWSQFALYCRTAARDRLYLSGCNRGLGLRLTRAQ